MLFEQVTAAFVGGLLAGTAKGKHSRSGYVELVFAIHRGRHSGRLKIAHGRRKRELFFLKGRPVMYRSDLPEEDLARTLVYSDLIPEDRVKWIADKLSPGEKLEEALVMSGSLTEKQLEEHLQSRTRPGISGPLSWSTGNWSFEALSAEFSEHFDVALLPEESALPALWHGVSQHVATDEVLPLVTDGKKGPLRMGDGGSDIVASLELSESFSGLENAIGTEATVEDVFRTIPDSTGGLFKLMWMLESGGVLRRENGSWKGRIDDIIQAAVDGKSSNEASASVEKPKKPSPKRPASPAPEPSAATPEGAEAEILQAHADRVGKDFYTFLGIPSPSPRKEVDKACKSLAQHWRTLDSAPGLSTESRRCLKDLLAGVQLVWRTLTDPKHKREYDRRLDVGRAPKVEARVARTPAGTPSKVKAEPKPAPQAAKTSANPLSRGQSLIASGKFKEAVAVLEEARMSNPSEPSILAELGWASWKARKWGEEEEGAEEFLRLALTFEPQNTRAMEFLARIAIEKGEKDKAKKILKRIMQLTKDSEWARTALLSLQKGQRSETVSRKRGFWRDKGDKS